MKIKCQKCRCVLTDSSCVLDYNGFPLLDKEANSTQPKENTLFINYDLAPDWIRKCLDEGEWKRGKLDCPKCESRVGNFNFVQPYKSNISHKISLSVWLIKSKVDIPIIPKVLSTKSDPNNLLSNESAVKTG